MFWILSLYGYFGTFEWGLLLVAHLDLRGHVDAHDESEQTDGRAEDLDDQNLDKQCRVGGIGQGRTGTDNTDGDTAKQVDQTDGQASAEHYITGEPVVVPDVLVSNDRGPGEVLQHAGQDDGRDETVDGDGFAEDDRDQVLGFDARGLDTSTDDAHSGRVNSHGRSDDGQRNGERNAEGGPHVRGRLLQEPADADALALAREDMVQDQDRRNRGQRSDEGVPESVAHRVAVCKREFHLNYTVWGAFDTGGHGLQRENLPSGRFFSKFTHNQSVT